MMKKSALNGKSEVEHDMPKNDNEKEYITLTFEDGDKDEEVEYEVMGAIEVEGSEYLVLIPENDKESLEVFGLEEIPGDAEHEEIRVIEDDDEYMAVIEALRAQGLKIEMED